MIDGMSVPEDWGVADKDIWIAPQPLEGEVKMPALEGRDVIGFVESINSIDFAAGQMKQQPAHDNRKQAAMVRKCDPGFHAQGNQCVQSNVPQPSPSQSQRMERAYDKRVDDVLSKPETERKEKSSASTGVQSPVTEEPSRETEAQRENIERAQKEIKKDTSVESYKQSEVFNATTIHDNEAFLKSPPHDIIRGKQFIDIKKELEATGLFPDGVNFPPKYLDLLSQLGITKAKGVDGPPLSDYIQGAGAGAPMSQVGELMMMTSSSMSDEQAEAYFEILSRVGDNSSVVNKDWVTAARRNRYALQRAITNNLGGGQVIAASWDVKGEVEELGLNYEDKGFSTDAFFRVRTNDGSEAIFEVSLKKDKNVFFINGGAASLAEESIRAMPSESPIRRQYEAIENSLQELKDKYNQGANFTAQYPKILKKMTDEQKEEIQQARQRYEELNKKRQDFLKENTSPYNTDIYMDRLVSNVYQPAATKILNDQQALNELERIANEGKVDIKKYLGKLKVGSIEEALRIISETPPEQSTVNHKKLLAKIFEATGKVGSENEILNRYAKTLGEEYQKFRRGLSNELAKKGSPLQTAVISNIRKEFPLKAVLNGEEVMCIGDANFDLKTAERIFGTTDINEINQKLTIKQDEKGNPILVYSAGERGEEIPIAIIGARQKGIGYEAMGFEAALHSRFYEKLQSAVVQENLDGKKRVKYTKAEAKKGPRDPSRHIPEGGSFTEKKKPTFEDYMEILRTKRASATEGGGANYADSMVFYKGKMLGRCPAGTTRSGKTCVPGAPAQAKGPGYKQQDLGGLSQAQVEALSKAKSTKDIIEAHKKQSKK